MGALQLEALCLEAALSAARGLGLEPPSGEEGALPRAEPAAPVGGLPYDAFLTSSRECGPRAVPAETPSLEERFKTAGRPQRAVPAESPRDRAVPTEPPGVEVHSEASGRPQRVECDQAYPIEDGTSRQGSAKGAGPTGCQSEIGAHALKGAAGTRGVSKFAKGKLAWGGTGRRKSSVRQDKTEASAMAAASRLVGGTCALAVRKAPRASPSESRIRGLPALPGGALPFQVRTTMLLHVDWSALPGVCCSVRLCVYSRAVPSVCYPVLPSPCTSALPFLHVRTARSFWEYSSSLEHPRFHARLFLIGLLCLPRPPLFFSSVPLVFVKSRPRLVFTASSFFWGLTLELRRPRQHGTSLQRGDPWR